MIFIAPKSSVLILELVQNNILLCDLFLYPNFGKQVMTSYKTHTHTCTRGGKRLFLFLSCQVFDGSTCLSPDNIYNCKNRIKTCRHRLSVCASCAFHPPLTLTDSWLQEKKLRAVQGVKLYLLRTRITSRPHVWYKLPLCICLFFLFTHSHGIMCNYFTRNNWHYLRDIMEMSKKTWVLTDLLWGKDDM